MARATKKKGGGIPLDVLEEFYAELDRYGDALTKELLEQAAAVKKNETPAP